jgi:TonB family protein
MAVMAEQAGTTRASTQSARNVRLPWIAVAVLCCSAASAQAPQEPPQAATNEQPQDVPEPAPGEIPASADDPSDPPEDVLEPIAPPETARPAPRDLVSRIEAQIEMRALAERGSYEEAVPVGEQVVRLTETEFGRRSRETADALTELAGVQRLAGQHNDAELNFLEAVETYRDIEGPYSALLVEPLVGLGDNYRGAGQHQNAVSAYNEARTVSRRAYGLLSERQIPIMDRMTAALLSMNLYTEAGEQQLAALELVERSHPPGSPEALEALYKYARHLRDVGRFREEREQYTRAIRIISSRTGERDHPDIVRPLREIGNSFRTQRIAEGQGASALNRALDILESQPDADPLTMAETLRDMGDWHVAFSRVGADGEEYRRAWQLLGRVENGEELRRDWFTGPEYALREPVSQRGLSNDPASVQGHVLVQFDVDEAGRPHDVRVLSAEPPGLKEEAVAQSVRRSRFRPQMRDGEIVRGERLALQFVYRYLPDDLE